MGQNVDIPVSSVFCGFVCHSNVCHQFKLNQALYTETKGLTTRVRKWVFFFIYGRSLFWTPLKL